MDWCVKDATIASCSKKPTQRRLKVTDSNNWDQVLNFPSNSQPVLNMLWAQNALISPPLSSPRHVTSPRRTWTHWTWLHTRPRCERRRYRSRVPPRPEIARVKLLTLALSAWNDLENSSRGWRSSKPSSRQIFLRCKFSWAAGLKLSPRHPPSTRSTARVRSRTSSERVKSHAKRITWWVNANRRACRQLTLRRNKGSRKPQNSISCHRKAMD